MDLKNPKECQSLEEIRKEIDKIDFQIISLFAKRHLYVSEIVKFKKDKESVIAQVRKDNVILQRSEWARQLGLDPKTFDKIFSILIEKNIQWEMELLGSQKSNKI